MLQPILKELIFEKRREMPRLGTRKLYHLLKPELQAMSIKIGRDKLFGFLREGNLLITPKKSYTKTTQSFHHFYKHRDLIKGLAIKHPDQVWVSDITYIRVQKSFAYLSLITDAYSRKIIGYNLSDSLATKGCIEALKMANKRKLHTTTIHHSDRGFQYCSKEYTNRLANLNIKVSMGEAGNCYDNALAERVNGILKSEFNLDAYFSNFQQANKTIKEAIDTYNNKRPHLAINYHTPNEFYQQKEYL